MVLSFATVTVHSLVTPTLTIWTSTECMRGCKSLLNSLAACLNCRWPCAEANQDSFSGSRRELALDQARRASAWRREQSCDRRNRSHGLILSDSVVNQLTNVVSPRPEANYSSQLSARDLMLLPPITVVKPLTKGESRPLSESPVTLSAISIKFSNLELTKHIVDPVNLIDCFKTSQLDDIVDFYGPRPGGRSRAVTEGTGATASFCPTVW